MKPRREDPCPCGSGRMYKKCCARSGGPGAQVVPFHPRDERDRERRATLRRRAADALFRYSLRDEFLADRERAFRALRFDPDDGQTSDDVTLKVLHHLVFDHRLPGGESLAQRFLATAGYTVGETERGWIRRMVGARLRPYEVADVELDRGILLVDLLSQERVYVHERLATHEVKRFDILAVRVTSDEVEGAVMEGGVYLLAPRHAKGVHAALRKAEKAEKERDAAATEDDVLRRGAAVIHRFWLDRVVHQPPPTIVTAEGDLLEFGRVKFAVLDPAALRKGLDARAELSRGEGDTWTWTEAKRDVVRSLAHLELVGRELFVEVASRARAKRARRMLEEAVPGLLRYVSARYDDPAEAARSGAHEPAEVPDEEATAVILDLKERHYRDWVDHPLPGLNGRTPRHAASLKTLRPRLVDLLKHMESTERRGPEPHYDFGWVWAELGLESPAGPSLEEAPMRKVPVDMAGLEDALTSGTGEEGEEWYLDLDTGEVLFTNSYIDTREEADLDGRDVLLIEPVPSREQYEWMVAFAETVEDRTLSRLLEVALDGKGAFRRFRNVVADVPAEEQRWRAFQQGKVREAARRWLEDEGIEAVERPR